MFESFIPLIIGVIVSTGKYENLLWFLLAYLMQRAIHFLSRILPITLQHRSTHSLVLAANQKILTADPVIHTTKDGGRIVSNFNRLSNSYRNFMMNFRDIFLTKMENIIGIITSFWIFDWFIGLQVTVLTILVLAGSVFARSLNLKYFEKPVTKAEDRYNSASLEGLTQTVYIRSLFATDQIFSKVKQSHKQLTLLSSASWLFNTFFRNILIYIYLIGATGISFQIFNLMQSSSLDREIAIALLIGIYQAVFLVSGIGKYYEKIMEALFRFNLAWDYIRDFGQQTYPVLPTRFGVRNS